MIIKDRALRIEILIDFFEMSRGSIYGEDFINVMLELSPVISKIYMEHTGLDIKTLREMCKYKMLTKDIIIETVTSKILVSNLLIVLKFRKAINGDVKS